jgi:hypothetical protein
MKRWFDRWRFLWEEEVAPPEEVPRGTREDPAGVPRPLRAATRFVLVGSLATSLMSQIVGVRMVAPVDAAPSYRVQCIKGCEQTQNSCIKNSQESYLQCDRAAKTKADHCKDVCRAQRGTLGSVGFNSCFASCERTYVADRATCSQQQRTRFNNCQTSFQTCKQTCNSGP